MINQDKNTPYKKEYKAGILTNPITDNFPQASPNRQHRRFKAKNISKKFQLLRTISGHPKWDKQRNKYFTGRVAS